MALSISIVIDISGDLLFRGRIWNIRAFVFWWDEVRCKVQRKQDDSSGTGFTCTRGGLLQYLGD